MKFKQSCQKLNIKTKTITFETIPEVYDDLLLTAQRENMTLPELMREIIDDFLLNQSD